MIDSTGHPYRKLQHRLGLAEDLPYTPDWSAAADFLEQIADYCLAEKPQLIVECSSGLSTLILARCCQINNQGQVISLENGGEFTATTEATLTRFSAEKWATVNHSPLTTTSVEKEIFQWYKLPELPNIPIDLLVIDGPSGFIQPLSRYPALPMLYQRLAPRCTIFLDDAARDDEQEIIRRWLASYPEFQYRYIDTERGCSILSRDLSK